MADDTEVVNEEAEHGDPEFAEVPEGAAAEGNKSESKTEGEDNPDEGEAASEAKPEAEAKPDTADIEQLQKTVKALTRRVGTLSAEKRDISKKLQDTIAAVPQKAADEPAAETEGEQPVRSDFRTQAEFDAAVRAEAVRVAAQQRAIEEWNNKCNAIEDNGSKTFGSKWVEAKSNLAVLDDEGRIPLDLLQTALETDNPAQVLFELGGNLERAAELMAMTPAKRAIAMDRMAQKKPAAERPRSQAPAPVDPITGRGGGSDAPSDRDSDEEWHRKDSIRRAEKRKLRLG